MVKNKNMFLLNKKVISGWLIFFGYSFWMTNYALAQCNPPPIINPDLEHNGTCAGCAPDGWIEYNGTPDIGNTTNVYCESDWTNACGTSAPGSSNDKIGRFRNETSSCNDLTAEGISQTISGLTPGQTYYLCFWAVNTGRGCDDNGPPQNISLQAIMGGTTNSVVIPYTGNGWAIYSIPVTANSATSEIVFIMPGATSGLGRGVILFDQVTLECNLPDGPCPSDLIGDLCDAGSGPGSGTYDANCNCVTLPCPPNQVGTPCDAGSGTASGYYDGQCNCIALNLTDSDGDGIDDADDLDDDNDGILDEVECPPSLSLPTYLPNGDFNQNYVDENNQGTPYFNANFDFVPSPWNKTSTPDMSTESRLDFNGQQVDRDIIAGFDASPSGGAFMGMRTGYSGGNPLNEGIYSTISIGNPNEQVIVQFDYTEYTNPFSGGAFVLDIINNGTSSIPPNDPGVNIVFRFDATTSTNGVFISGIQNFSSVGGVQGTWYTRTVSFTPASLGYTTPGTYDFYIGSNNSSEDTWAFMDDIEVISNNTPLLSCDTDNDNISDHLDLDSDNDGCPDFIEGNGSFTSADGYSAGTLLSDGNGGVALFNLGTIVNTNPGSSSYGVPLVAGTGQGVGDSNDPNVTACISCPLTCQIVNPVNETCANAGDGSFSVNTSSSDPLINNFEYSINGGASWSSNNNFAGLSVGAYTVLSREVGGTNDCTANCTITLNCVNQTNNVCDECDTECDPISIPRIELIGND